MSSRSRLNNSFLFPIRFVFLIWVIFFLSVFFPLPIGLFGIIPREVVGLIGILTAPLIHGNFIHLLSNSIPLIILGSVLFFFYDRIAPTVFFYCYFLTNGLVWVFARPFSHIGASGVVYGVAFFLLFIGIFKKDIVSILISIAVAFFYGGIIWGIIPGDSGISWESHLIGAIVGTYCAFIYGSNAKVSRY